MALSIRSELSPADPRARARRLARPASGKPGGGGTGAGCRERAGRDDAIRGGRLAGLERQALRDAVTRCDAGGLPGLEHRPKPGRPPGLTEGSGQKARQLHPHRRVVLHFQDEAGVGQKGRVRRRRRLRGQRPPGLHDRRFDCARIPAAVAPATGNDLCLVLPRVSTHAMSAFLPGFPGRGSRRPRGAGGRWCSPAHRRRPAGAGQRHPREAAAVCARVEPGRARPALRCPAAPSHAAGHRRVRKAAADPVDPLRSLTLDHRNVRLPVSFLAGNSGEVDRNPLYAHSLRAYARRPRWRCSCRVLPRPLPEPGAP